MRLLIRSLPGNERGPRHMEAVLRAIHAANPERLPVTLSYEGVAALVGFSIECPEELKSTLLEHQQDAYPDCHMEVVRDDRSSSERPIWSQSVWLSPDVLPLRSYGDFETQFERETVDPTTGLLSALRSESGSRVTTALSIRVQPASRHRVREAERILSHASRSWLSEQWRRRYLQLRTSRWRLTRMVAAIMGKLLSRAKQRPERTQESIELKQPLFEAELTVSVSGCVRQCAMKQSRRVLGALGALTTAKSEFRADQLRKQPARPKRGVLLSAAELALLMHPSVSTLGVAGLPATGFRELEPPPLLPSPDDDPGSRHTNSVTLLGRVQYRGQRRRFGIYQDDLRRHLLLCGKTGTGKSTLIRSMVQDAIEANRNVFVVDPHGDLVGSILDNIPRFRTNDVIYFNAADRSHPVAFNPLDCRDEFIEGDSAGKKRRQIAVANLTDEHRRGPTQASTVFL